MSKGGASMSATYCLNALLSSFVNLLSFHYKRHNQNKSDKNKSRNELECEAFLRCAISRTKALIILLYYCIFKEIVASFPAG